MTKHRLPTTPPSEPAMSELGITPTTRPAKFDSTAVFDSQIRPVLATMETRNREAAGRALAAIHNHFKNARLGVPDFAESISGPLDNFKSLYLGSKGYVERWWYERDDLQPMADHVQWNYENHVTSGPKMKVAITAAMERFQRDVRANRNEAIQAINANIQTMCESHGAIFNQLGITGSRWVTFDTTD